MQRSLFLLPILLSSGLLSGQPRDPMNRPEVDGVPARYGVEDLYAGLGTTGLLFPVGEHWSYANLGFGLLGHVLARVGDRRPRRGGWNETIGLGWWIDHTPGAGTIGSHLAFSPRYQVGAIVLANLAGGAGTGGLGPECGGAGWRSTGPAAKVGRLVRCSPDPESFHRCP